MKKKMIPVTILSLVLILLCVKTYANYKSAVKVNVHGTSGKIECNASIDSNSYVSDNGYAAFKVTVTNYNGSKLTNVPFKYKLTVENNNSTVGNYRFDDSSFSKKLVTDYKTFGASTEESEEFLIEVKADTNVAQTVNYKVTLDCYQINE